MPIRRMGRCTADPLVTVHPNWTVRRSWDYELFIILSSYTVLPLYYIMNVGRSAILFSLGKVYIGLNAKIFNTSPLRFQILGFIKTDEVSDLKLGP